MAKKMILWLAKRALGDYDEGKQTLMRIPMEKAIPEIDKQLVEHVLSPDCWCSPILDYKNPDTGEEVWIHRYPEDAN